MARFRSLTIYVILKSALLLLVGLIGTRIKNVVPPSLFDSSFFYLSGILLSIVTCILHLMLGLTLASTRMRRPRSLGLILLCVADVCVVLVVLYACILNNTLILLLMLVVTSCTTPFFLERISRYARSFQQSKHELQRIQQTLDELLRQYSDQLANSIEYERSSFRRKVHDGLMQDLTTAHLQVGILLMRNDRDSKAQFSVEDFADVEASLHRVIDDARVLMQDGKAPWPTLENR
ncbi:MAG: hypothetical protein ABI406_21275 [Ktedonobacteraceae bacterium]